jgi:hypothetical protein
MVATAAPAAPARRRVYVVFISAFGGVVGSDGWRNAICSRPLRVASGETLEHPRHDQVFTEDAVAGNTAVTPPELLWRLVCAA